MTPSRTSLSALLRIPPYLIGRSPSPRSDVSLLPNDEMDSAELPSVVDCGNGELPFLGHSLRRMRQAGLVVFLVELVGLGVWSSIVWERFSLTWDFSLLDGAATTISHSTFSAAWQTVKGHFDAVILWPMAWLTRLPPHGLVLLWAQDLAVVGAAAVAFLWICDILERRSTERSISSNWLAGLGLVLLLANPWIFLTPAFDLHLEAFGTVFILLAARDLYRGRLRSSLLWVAATVTCGFVAATYIAGLALGALLDGRKQQRGVGIGLLAAGVIGFLMMTVLGQASTFVVTYYSYLTYSRASTLPQLAGYLLIHPSPALKLLWEQRERILANLAPSGLLGVFSGWGAGVALLIVLENILQANDGLRTPSFQWLALYMFVAVGTVMVLQRLSDAAVTKFARGAVLTLVVFTAADTFGWAAVWTPTFPGTWLRVSPAAAKVLRQLDATIPKNAPMIVSQGVVGDFPSHPWFFALTGGTSPLPTSGAPVWVVLAPAQGIEIEYPGQQQALVTRLAQDSNAKLIAHGAGVWGFRWTPSPGTNLLTVPGPTAPIGGWAIVGSSGRQQMTGPSNEWAAVSTGRPGYVVSGDYYYRNPGSYDATVMLSSSGPAVIEVWNKTGNTLLRRVPIGPTHGETSVTVPVTLKHLYRYEHTFHGWGPFSVTPAVLPKGNDVEVRVLQPAGGALAVYSVSLS